MDNHRQYRALASSILMQAHRDLKQFPKKGKKERGGVSDKDYLAKVVAYSNSINDIKSFINGNWCASLCDMVGIDYHNYRKKIKTMLWEQNMKTEALINRLERIMSDLSG